MIGPHVVNAIPCHTKNGVARYRRLAGLWLGKRLPLQKQA
jgi:hypothetical protein